METQKLAEVIKFFSLIHHTPGRLRLRVSPQIKAYKDEFDLENLDKNIKNIEGINRVKFNQMIGSVTIEYDKNIFSKDIWDNLLQGNSPELITSQLKQLTRR